MTVDDRVLDRCLEDLRAKRATVADCLAKYPDLADELKPLLETAAALEAAPEVRPSAAFKQATRARLLHFQHRPTLGERLRQIFLPAGGGQLRYAAAAMIIVLLFTAFTGGMAYAASDSLPGSAFYPIKRAAEQVELALANTPESQARVRIEFADRRLDEATKLAKAGEDQLAEQAVKEYSVEVNAAIAILPLSSSKESSPINQSVIKSLNRQQETLRVIQVPATAKKTVEDAIGVSKRAIERLSIEPAPPPAARPTAKPKSGDTPTTPLPAVVPSIATETPRGDGKERRRETPQSPGLLLEPTLTVPLPETLPMPTITLTVPVLPGPKATLPMPFPGIGK